MNFRNQSWNFRNVILQLSFSLFLLLLRSEPSHAAFISPAHPSIPARSTWKLLASSKSSSSSQPRKRRRRDSRSEDTKTDRSDTIASVYTEDTSGEPLVQTLGGGTSMIFEMARRMLVWNEDEAVNAASDDNMSKAKSAPSVLPRWHPHAGISDVNPSFRTQAPVMNSQGYAGVIWRNVRKRNKPSLWRHALRTYNRMAAIEEQQQQSATSSALKIKRSNVHHEGALLACAKLGLWQEALQIYKHTEETATTNQTVSVRIGTTARAGRRAVFVTENMVLSVISACVRGAKRLAKDDTSSVEERRAPLEAAVAILETIEERHGIPLVARHVNPLAAAYQSLGLLPEASRLLNSLLTNRTIGPEEENGDDPFNINDVNAKDKGSYALLVTGAVSTGDWGDAVDALREMTEAGLYPKERHLNAWTEVSERKQKQRTTRSWKKKRDEHWLESVR